MADFLKDVVTMAEPYVDMARPYMETARLHAHSARRALNEACAGLESWQVIFYTFGATLLLVWIHGFLFQEESLFTRIKKSFFRLIRKLPIIKGKIQKEIDKTKKGMIDEFNEGLGSRAYVTQLPAKGLTEKQIMKELDSYKSIAKVKWGEGKCSGSVYNGEDHLTKFMTRVYGEFAWHNPLHADVFPDVRKMEAEVVRMTCAMFNGGPDSCGTMSGGGTESILLAIRAYRDWAYDKGIKNPEIIVPITAHAAFDKGAQYFRVKIIHVPIDEKTRQVKISSMRRAITRNTCMLVGSAPQFPHGIMDPIVEIAKLGRRYNIPVHVDSCLGGFLVPFMKKAGFELEPFDFSVPGVTSISADTHKYGFAPKGSSVILYSDSSYRKFQFFAQVDWPGGIYASPTIAGSRSGAIIAATWATMMYYGEKGYVETTRRIVTTTRYIIEGLREIHGLHVYGDPQVSVVGFGSKHFNIYRLSDALTARGWNLNALQFPSSIHLAVTLLHTHSGVADNILSDVRECTREIMKDPHAKAGGQAAVYGMAQSVPDRSLVHEMAGGFFDAYYNTEDSEHSKMNGINGTT